MAREISTWMHSANLTDGTGQTTDIVLNPNSYWFACAADLRLERQ